MTLCVDRVGAKNASRTYCCGSYRSFSMSLNQLVDQLAPFTPTEFPVLSLYLNAQADQHGRDSFASFVRKELPTRAKTYQLRSPARESFDRDAERIKKYLQDEVQSSTNGIAIFACAGAE